MTNRPPAVAGTFYEGNPERLRQQLGRCFAMNDVVVERRRFIGAVVPHAGLMYSGRVAAAFYAAVELPRRFVILCPNHTGVGSRAAINRNGSWRTPLGAARIDDKLAAELMQRNSLLQEDDLAHAREHSLEVQLPFLQQQRGDFAFVPICLALRRYDSCEELGHTIADAIAAVGGDEPIGILASSDLNHYEDQETTLRKDALAIAAVLALDPRELWRVVEDFDVSMCGYIPTIVMLIAAKRLGASNATLLMHATSGDVNRDYTHVVGYAAISVE